MGASKTDEFTLEQNEMSAIFKAIGHPARIAILEFLLKSPGCICGDIVNDLPLSQPTVSQHLRELKNAGWIKGSIEGNAICYCVDAKAIVLIEQFAGKLTNALMDQKNKCC